VAESSDRLLRSSFHAGGDLRVPESEAVRVAMNDPKAPCSLSKSGTQRAWRLAQKGGPHQCELLERTTRPPEIYRFVLSLV
jgi:hypothetical protein